MGRFSVVKQLHATCVIVAVIACLLLTGCAGFKIPSPAIPSAGNAGLEPHRDDDKRHSDLVTFGNEVTDAYRSRARWNRYFVYIGGAIALAGASALAGLAAFEKADSDAAKAIPVATVFTGGFFAMLNNKSLATSYEQAANKIQSAIAQSEVDEINKAGNAKLNKAITDAINTLEAKRNDIPEPQAPAGQTKAAPPDAEDVQPTSGQDVSEELLQRITYRTEDTSR